MVIRRRRNRGGTYSWQLDCGTVNGKRLRLSFPSRDEAEDAKERRSVELRKHGQAVLDISAEERSRFVKARDRLAAAGATIDDAVSFYLKHHQPLRPMAMKELFDAFIADKLAKGKRERYVKQLGVSMKRFLQGRELRNAHEITREDVDAWLYGTGWAPKTQRVYLGDLRTLFSWALKRKHVTINPCLEVELPEAEQAEIEILSVEQCERLLNTALTHRRTERLAHPYAKPVGTRLFIELLGFAVLGMFCGIRPQGELGQMEISDLDLDEKTAVVRAAHAKTRSRRVVDIPDNAIAWLRVWRAECPHLTTIRPRNARKLWERLRKQAGIGHWPHDAMRHTAASMLYALTQNESRVKAQLGHSAKEDTLMRHYRSIKLPDGRTLTKAEAEKFFNLMPPVAQSRCEKSTFSASSGEVA